MKKLKLGRIAILFLIGLLPSAGFAAKADTGNVIMSENENTIVLKCDNDLFSGFKNMMPGQTADQVIQIDNTSSETLTLYLRAENAQLSDFDNESQRQLSQDLIQQCQLSLKEVSPAGNNKIIYTGPASGSGSESKMTDNISLGNFQSNSSANITATMTVPSTVSNRYQNAAAKVRWVFVAEGKDKTVEVPISPKTGNDSRSSILVLTVLCSCLVLIIYLTVLHIKRTKKTI